MQSANTLVDSLCGVAVSTAAPRLGRHPTTGMDDCSSQEESSCVFSGSSGSSSLLIDPRVAGEASHFSSSPGASKPNDLTYTAAR